MTPDDRAAVIALLAGSDPWKRLGYAPEFWERAFSPLPQGRESLVLQQGDDVAGIALVRPKFLFGDYLELLAVAPTLTGQGLGRLLLTHVESLAFTRGKNLFACVSDFNTGARRFYRRHGFVEIGPLADLLVPGSAEILLRKTIGPAKEAAVPSPVS
ncbi:MAG TPA: GNAT family N-acetyltransferase [Nitrospiraceae bacterium]|nr:GNAT family N-acetyltransferase [Nitrospiraceae bacterium]